VAGAANITGNTAITGSLSAATVTAGAATVNGNLATGTIQASGNVSAGSLSATGQASAASLSVPGTAAAGTVQASNLNATNATIGSATFNTGLNARQSRVSVLSGGTSVNPGTYQALTDGFVIGVVAWPSSTSPGCVGYAVGQSAGMTVCATGGNLGAFGPGWSDYQASNGNTFVLPVAAGNYWAINAYQCDGGLEQAAAPISFYWVPLGTAPGATTFKWVSDEQLEIRPAIPEGRGDADAARAEFVAILEQALGKDLGQDVRQRLLEVLSRI
jgi:hypothetical protein